MICENDTAFDVLAELCSLLSKEDERKCEIRWKTAKEEHIQNIVGKYKDFEEIVLNSSDNEYRFNIDEIIVINTALEEFQMKSEADGQQIACDRRIQDEIFLLAIKVEQNLGTYQGWVDNFVFHSVPPLNNNVEKSGIEVFPRTCPFWDLNKSERNRAHTLNSHFKNYMIVRKEERLPFQLDMYYWNGSGLLDGTTSDKKLTIALSPIMDYAQLETENLSTKSGNTIRVNGLKNKEIVTQKVLNIFDYIFLKKYSFIVFTECLGTIEIVEEVKQRMRRHPEICTFVVLPTICEKDQNKMIVLGPGGIECLRHNKATPFILLDEGNVGRREQLEYENHISVLITEELGMIVFPICAEFLEPGYYKAMTEIAMTDMVICPSFSPGVQAFIDTMLKGSPLKLLQLYVNTCSAKEISRNRRVAEPLGMVQLPYVAQKGNQQESPLIKMKKECEGNCVDALCYFHISISYDKNSQRFDVKKEHCHCRKMAKEEENNDPDESINI